MKHSAISTRACGPASILALPLILAAAVVLTLTIQAGSGPFDGSSVMATAEKVSIDQQVGFDLYVMNAGSLTATDVLVWNPLPLASTYVSASGGAFPVAGIAVNDLIREATSAHPTHPARLWAMGAGTSADPVTGIAWVGDIAPGQVLTLGLVVTANNPAGRFLVDEMFLYDDADMVGRFSGQAWVPPHRIAVPLVVNRFTAPNPTPTPTTSTVTFTIPYSQGLAIGGGSVDPDYWQALAGSDLEGRFRDGEGVSLGQSPPNGPYLPNYKIGRAYMGWDTSGLPDEAEVVSATLILEVPCSPPDTVFGVTIYQGVWVPPLDEDAWYAVGQEPIGSWNTADYPCTGYVGSGQVWIDLDTVAINPSGLTLLEIRSDREGTPPVAPEQVLVMRSPWLPALLITFTEEP